MTKFDKLLLELDSKRSEEEKIDFLLEEMKKSAQALEELNARLAACEELVKK